MITANRDTTPTYHAKGASIERSTFNSRGDYRELYFYHYKYIFTNCPRMFHSFIPSPNTNIPGSVLSIYKYLPLQSSLVCDATENKR